MAMFNNIRKPFSDSVSSFLTAHQHI